MGVKILRASLLEWIIVILVILAVIAQPLGLTFYGEIITVLSIGYLLLRFIRTSKISKYALKMITLLLGVVCIGYIGNFTSGIERSLWMIFRDIIYITKDFICFVGVYLFFTSKKFSSKPLLILGSFARTFTVVAFVCFGISLFADIGMSDSVRYGITSYKFIYNSEAWLNQYWIGIVLLLTADLENQFNKRKLIYILMALIVWISTLRSRAFVMVAVYAFLAILLFKKNKRDTALDYKKRVFNFKSISCSLVLVAVIAYDQIENYFLGTVATARALLLQNGFKIMRDYFPFGSGFGTFGTETAKIYYSPLYYKYGLNKFWALTEGGSELTDCYWPAIAAELGIIGLILVGILVFILIKKCLECTKNNKYIFFAMLLEVMYLLFSSTATAIFASDVTATYMLIIGLLLGYPSNEKLKE